MAYSSPESQRSPYERALGARAGELHPGLRSYFETIPEGRVGIGEGVFDRVGARKRWIRPFLAVLQRAGVVHAGWSHGVPFSIENRTVGGRAVSERRFELPGGTWEMRDTVGLNRAGRLVDAIGRTGAVVASFDLDVERGELRLTSRAVGLRIGGRTVRLPRPFAPVVRLRERSADADAGADTGADAAANAGKPTGAPAEPGIQLVDVTIDAPLIGRIYEYGGWFRYRIEEDA